MELRVKELCKMRGLTMGQLADKMGVNLSNLSASINGNPTLERLQDIAKNLGVEVYELFRKPSDTSGIIALAEINGEQYKITTAEEWAEATQKIEELAKIPLYRKDSDLRKSIKDFILSGINGGKPASLFGQLAGREIFCLSRNKMEKCDDTSDNIFSYDMTLTLTLFRGNKTFIYSLIEYIDNNSYDLDGGCGLVMNIRNEIESFMDSAMSATE